MLNNRMWYDKKSYVCGFNDIIVWGEKIYLPIFKGLTVWAGDT